MPNTSVLLIFKVLVLVTWFLGAAGFLFPPDTTLGSAGRTLFVLLAAVHLVECGFFFRTLQRTGRPLGMELLNTLLFGVVHFAEARALAEANDRGDEAGRS